MSKDNEATIFKAAFALQLLVAMGLYFYKLLVNGETSMELMVVLLVGVFGFVIGKFMVAIKRKF